MSSLRGIILKKWINNWSGKDTKSLVNDGHISMSLIKPYDQVSDPNFVRGPLFVGMRLSLDHLKMFNTHRCGIRKVSRCFEKKPVKNMKMGVYLAKWGVCK